MDSSRINSAGRRFAGGVVAFWRRGPVDRVAALRMLPVLLRIEVGLRRTSLPALARRLGIRVQTDPTTPVLGAPELSSRERADVDAARRLIRRWPAEAVCLRRALLIGYALRGRRPVLAIGAARHDGQVHAHAWIQVDGVVVEERSVEHVPLRRARPGPS